MQSDLPAEITTIMRATIEAHHICWRAPEIEEESSLEDIGFDHLDRMTLACRIDEHFDIYLPDEAIAGWERVADVIASVEALLAAKEARAA